MTKSLITIEERKKLCCKASDMVNSFSQKNPIKFESILNNIAGDIKRYDCYYDLLNKKILNKNDIELSKALRDYRLEQQVELACKDILGQISVSNMLTSLSDLAKACLNISYEYIYNDLEDKYGSPLCHLGQKQHLVIFGMGKLGGGELNFSSDIDLIFAYPKKGETQGNENGDRSIDNELFFHRLVQNMIKLLDKYDENGFVYRVDTRLKPFGRVGTLCINFETMKRYYIEHGRSWERYALIKMAAVAGDIVSGNSLIEDLTPFIYQRQVDYEALGSIEDMKTRIFANTQEKNLRDNIKLGHGGIREIEFLVQTYQMMYGGRIEELRCQSLLDALIVLQGKDIIDKKVAEMLRNNYLRLRKIENAIQYYRDQQTHDLPNKTEPRNALMVALKEDNWLSFVDSVARVRFEVCELFKRIFATQDNKTPHVDKDKLTEEYWLDLIYQTDITRSGAESISSSFLQFYKRMKNHDLGEKYLIRLNWVLPQVIAALDGQKNPIKIAKHMLNLLESIIDESVYLSLLVEHPSVLKKIMHLFMHSSWMTNFLCDHPRVIDELIHEAHEDIDVEVKTIQEELDYAISQIICVKDIISKLIDFKNAQTFRVASADMQKKIRLMNVSDQLTWIAESIINTIFNIVIDELTKKYGYPTYEYKKEIQKAEFGIVAYGKLGGLEMGYNSDLDLVFLHSSRGEKQYTDGTKSIPNYVFFTRVVGKFNNYISTLTSSGKLYEVDIRLRPSGNSGLLVHSLDAFYSYQQKEAWTWEHQALVRARFICGGKSVEYGFKEIRQSIIEKDRDIEKLTENVINMRNKMHKTFERPDVGMVHVKHERGGVTDIEFIVQYLLLRYTKEHRHLVRCSDNMRQLAALEVFGILRSSDASDLRNAYRQFRYWIHHQQLLGQRAVAPAEKFERQMQDVIRIWNKTFDVDSDK